MKLVESFSSDMKEIVEGFLTAALFVGTTDEGEPLDDTYSIRDFDKKSVKKAEDVVKKFLAELAELEFNYEDVTEDNHKDLEDLGIDLYMTMTGQGVTFKDWDEYSDKLYNAAKATLKKFYVETTLENGDGTVGLF